MFEYNKYVLELNIPGTSTLMTNKEENIPEQVVLVPQPTSSLNDPLNWGPIYKNFQFVMVCCYVFILSISMNWFTPVSAVFVEAWNVSYSQINLGSAVMFFVLIPACLAIQICCNTCGRRFIYITSLSLTILSAIVFAVCPNYKGFLAYCGINGIAVSPINVIVEITVADMLFLHQHGKYIAVFVLCLNLGATFGTVFGGYVSADLPTWSWMNYIIIIIASPLLICMIFFLEESMFEREDQLINVQSHSIDGHKLETVVSVREVDSMVPRKNFLARMKLLADDRKPLREQFFKLITGPFLTLRYPAVVWCTLTYGLQICWYSLIGNTLAQFYSAEPYLFSSRGIGNLSYASLPGLLAALLYLSFSDRYQIRKASANNGISEPEFRLDLLYFPVIINVLGLCLYGFGPAFQMSWVVGALGIAFINFGILGVTSIMFTFILESYPKQATSTILMIIIVQNTIGGIFCWVFQYWMDALTLKGITAFLAAMCFVFNFASIILRLYGKNFRHYTMTWYENASLD